MQLLLKSDTSAVLLECTRARSYTELCKNIEMTLKLADKGLKLTKLSYYDTEFKDYVDLEPTEGQPLPGGKTKVRVVVEKMKPV
jgi:hypothetical protein